MSGAGGTSRPTEGPLRRVALWSGPASIGISAVGILAATLLAPWFSWTGNALSDLGAAGASTALLFNGTLIFSGLLGIPFALLLLTVRDRWVRWIGTLLFGAAMPMLALIGVFALPSSYHGPVAVSFFLLFTIGIFVDGIGAILAGNHVDGALSIGLAVLHVLGWIVWGIVALEGVALPELVGSAAIWVWVVRRFRELRGFRP